MRQAGWILLAAACAGTRGPEDEHEILLRRGSAAAARADWSGARDAFEQAAVVGGGAEADFALAGVLLPAYGEIYAAERLYRRRLRADPARAVHGLGRCALWRGEDARAIDLFRESLRLGPTTACARDLAVRLLGLGEPADDALDLVEELSGDTLRSGLLLAAAGRRPRPPALPAGWEYGLERARLGSPGEIGPYVSKACATPRAATMMRRVLAGSWVGGGTPATGTGGRG